MGKRNVIPLSIRSGKMGSLFLLASFAFCVTTAWDNNSNGPLYKVCPDSQSIVRVSSIYVNEFNDRRYEFTCKRRAALTSRCHWSGYSEEIAGDKVMICRVDHAIRGVYSVYDSNAKTRWFSFLCCKQRWRKQGQCQLTDYINDLKGDMYHYVPKNSVLHGFRSFHNDTVRDHRWKLNICSQIEK